MDLQEQGYLANVKCAEVICDLTPDFFKEYLGKAVVLMAGNYLDAGD